MINLVYANDDTIFFNGRFGRKKTCPVLKISFTIKVILLKFLYNILNQMPSVCLSEKNCPLKLFCQFFYTAVVNLLYPSCMLRDIHTLPIKLRSYFKYSSLHQNFHCPSPTYLSSLHLYVATTPPSLLLSSYFSLSSSCIGRQSFSVLFPSTLGSITS